jgi:diguanylate cyclase (GGDEF)-like protein
MNAKERSGLAKLGALWSSTSFASGELSHYALPRITEESRYGVAVLSLISLVFVTLAFGLCQFFRLGAVYTYTYAALACLSAHIYWSAWRIPKVKALYLLAMTLLVICGSSLVMIAQQTGKIDTIVSSSVAVVLMLVPLVPWGLREASITIGAIYFMFTTSTMISHGRFSMQELWMLQLLMLFTSLVSAMLVIRALAVRKHDLATQFALQQAHNEMRELSNRDHLTGACNRRFIENQFDALLAAQRVSGEDSHFALFDIDRFKQINDTAGHECGDEMLKAVERGFVKVLRENECLARIGGDEFALMICGPAPEARIRAALSMVAAQAVAADPAGRFSPAFSTGLVRLSPGRTWNFGEAYRLADRLLYDAKRAGGDRILQDRMPDHSPDGAAR